MAQTIDLPDNIMDLVRAKAGQHDRSVVKQITHWLTIGRSLELSGGYDDGRVTAALGGEMDAAQLSHAEHEVWLEMFTTKMQAPSAIEKAFHDLRQARGHGVGLDENGKLVHASGNTRS